MNQDLRLVPSVSATPSELQSSNRSISRVRSASPPRPELPAKWRDKRQQVWSVARLRREQEGAGRIEPSATDGTLAVTDTGAASALPTERSEGNWRWREGQASPLPTRELGQTVPSTMLQRQARLPFQGALMWSGLELSRAVDVVRLPVGMFVAGMGLALASGLHLFVIIPALVLRRGLVRFARWAIRLSGSRNRKLRHLAHA